MAASDVTLKNDRIARYSNYLSQISSQTSANTIFNLDSGSGRNNAESTYLETILGEYSITPDDKKRLLGIPTQFPKINILNSISSVIAKYSDPSLISKITQITSDASGNIILVNPTDNKVFKINPYTGTIDDITPALDLTTVGFIGKSGLNVYAFDTTSLTLNILRPDNSLTKIQFRVTDPPPSFLTVDSTGNIYYTSSLSNGIYKITLTNNTYSYPELTIGGVLGGFSNSQGLNARFNNPSGISIDSLGYMYIADTINSILRKIDLLTLNVTTYAGNDSFLAFNTLDGSGNRDEPLSSRNVLFTNPSDLIFDSNDIMYIADTGNNSIRKITNGVITTIGGVPGVDNTYYPSTPGYADGSAGYTLYNAPTSLTYSNSRLYVLDKGNNLIREI
jgi:hypothetical protein